MGQGGYLAKEKKGCFSPDVLTGLRSHSLERLNNAAKFWLAGLEAKK